MQKKGKLELTWVGKYDEEKPVEPRILLEDTETLLHSMQCHHLRGQKK